ncbi:ABC transporter substrate-binding protein [Nakamurella leprariae]|uniref:ABC transporter substrate-binding protein n=1 Tax=Nakamurella leprariae TaxID=2803911 RepID=A0A939C1Q3_9ACTN|nr:ABC transporter substrate-binding protein [Nakamurella leprariae]MBM9467367.1 ABC transporter substrate-binding protein [Nakamurella leprariae]
MAEIRPDLALLASLNAQASTESNLRALTRRSVLRGAGALLAAGGASAFLAACGGGNPAGNVGGTSGAAATAGGAAAVSDTLTVAAASSGTIFDPDVRGNTSQYQMLYDTLFDTSTPPDATEAQQYLADFEPMPSLATKWESNDDNSVWTITLNTEATSPFGNKLTSADVLWSFERHLALKWYAGIFLNRVGVTDISQIEAPSDDTVVMNLAGPVGRSYFLLLMGCYIVPILDSVEGKKHVTGDDPWGSEFIKTNACGFGPYTLASSAPDGSMNVFEANPNYYAEVPIKTITWRQTTETSTQLQLLLRGEVQLIDGLSPIQVDQVDASDMAKVTRVATTGNVILGFNHDQEHYGDVELHQGIAYALPFDDIINSVYRGQATQMKSVLVDFLLGATDEYWVYERDLDKARTLLAPYADAGLVLQYQGGDTLVQTLAVLMQSSLAEAGLNIQLEALDPSTYQTKITEATMSMWIDSKTAPLVPASLYALQLLYPTAPTQVLLHYSNSVVDEAVGALASASDQDEQIELIRTAQEQLMKDLPIVPIAQTGQLVPTAINIENVRGHGANAVWPKGLEYS